MNAEDMTPEELRALANLKEQEQEQFRITKIGYLKCDLYTYVPQPERWFCTLEEKEEWCRDSFTLLYPKGSQFLCTIYEGEESWVYDKDPDGDDWDTLWAEKFLENIETPFYPKHDPEFDVLPPEIQEKRRVLMNKLIQEAKERCQ